MAKAPHTQSFGSVSLPVARWDASDSQLQFTSELLCTYTALTQPCTYMVVTFSDIPMRSNCTHTCADDSMVYVQTHEQHDVVETTSTVFLSKSAGVWAEGFRATRQARHKKPHPLGWLFKR